MWYFIIGALIGIVTSVFRWGAVQTLQMPHPFQGLIVSALLGAGVYGTILWLIARFVF